MTQNFDKAGFIAFADNLLYSMEDYGCTLHLEEIRPGIGGQSAIVFTAALCHSFYCKK